MTAKEQINDIIVKISALMNAVEHEKTAGSATGLAMIDKPGVGFVKWAEEEPQLKDHIYRIWNDVVKRLGERGNYGGAHVFFINSWNKRFKEGVVPVPCKYTHKRAAKVYIPAPNETVEDFQKEAGKTKKAMDDAVNSTKKIKKVKEASKKIIDIQKTVTDSVEKADKDFEKSKDKGAVIRMVKQYNQQLRLTKEQLAMADEAVNRTEKVLYMMEFVPVTSVDFEKEMAASLAKITDGNTRLEKETATMISELDKLAKQFDSMVNEAKKKKVVAKKAFVDPVSLIGIGAAAIALLLFSYKKGWFKKAGKLLSEIDNFMGWFNTKRQKDIEELINLKSYSRFTGTGAVVMTVDRNYEPLKA